MLSYFGRSILLALLTAIPSILVGSVLGAVIGMLLVATGSVFSPAAGQALGVFVGLATLFVGMLFFYRFGIVLPATALGRPFGFGEAWRATRGTLGAVLLLTLITTVAETLGSFLITGQAGFGAPPLVRSPLSFAFAFVQLWAWFVTMIGVSLLTALYGHYVEKRELAV